MKHKKLKKNDFSVADRMLNKVKAWRAGKNVILTVDNPDKRLTNERVIRVKAVDYWGDPNKKKKKED